MHTMMCWGLLCFFQCFFSTSIYSFGVWKECKQVGPAERGVELLLPMRAVVELLHTGDTPFHLLAWPPAFLPTYSRSVSARALHFLPPPNTSGRTYNKKAPPPPHRGKGACLESLEPAQCARAEDLVDELHHAGADVVSMGNLAT